MAIFLKILRERDPNLQFLLAVLTCTHMCTLHVHTHAHMQLEVHTHMYTYFYIHMYTRFHACVHNNTHNVISIIINSP